MPCACERCLQHQKTLGLGPRPSAKAAIHKAYRSAAKTWHPDRFQKNPTKQAAAEERFKLIQIAYRELWEHYDEPRILALEGAAMRRDSYGFSAQTSEKDETPEVSFGGMPGCFVPPDFSPYANQMILSSNLESKEKVVAFVDLAGGASRLRGGEFILLTSYRIFVRDADGIVAFLWLTDIGDVRFVDRLRHGKPRIWQHIVDWIPGLEPQYSLLIHRLNGTVFYALGKQTNDMVKRVIYNFLRQKKSQSRS